MLRHVAITVNRESDLNLFYGSILGFSEIRRFTLPDDLSDKLFGISDATEVVLLNSGDIYLEVFLSDRKTEPVYSHICISVQNRMDILKLAELNGYSVTRVERASKEDLVFIRDCTGNSFELVEELI